MNSKDIIRRGALIVLIIISIGLSIKIWTNLSSSTSSETNESSAVTKTNHPQDVFVPTKLIFSDNDEYKMTERESIVDGAFDEFIKLKLIDLKELDLKKDKNANLLNEKPTLIFSYPDILDLDYYLSVFSESTTFDDEAPFAFNRILIYEKAKCVFFYNSRNNKYYQATIDDSWDSVNNELKKEDDSYQLVDLDKETLPTLFYYKESIQLPAYSYILSSQAYTSFTKIFFNHVDDVVSNDPVNSEDVSLSNSYGENLAIRSQTGEVSYVGKFQSDGSDETTIYGKSFNYIRLMESMYTNLRYFDVEDTLIIYQNYVEGYPVFGTEYKGQLQINIAKNDDVIILTNQKTIQIPVPSDDVVELQATESIMNTILEGGIDVTKLQDLQIGYTWKSREDVPTVIDLVPEWYVKYDTKWQSVSNLLYSLK